MRIPRNNFRLFAIVSALAAGICAIAAIAQTALPVRCYEGKTIEVTIGDASVLSVEYIDYPGALENCVFVRIHEDEDAALAAGRAFVEKNGGRLVVLHYGGGRRMQFTMDGAMYLVDANRMFSEAGLAESMVAVAPGASEWEIDNAERGITDDAAIAEARKYASQVLALLDGFPVVIALHNDSDGGWNVRTYENEPDEASRVYVAADTDPDDFVIVTKQADFDAIAALDISAVLQNNADVPEDGSLSVYFRNSEVRYFNCEAEDGEIGRQTAMLEDLMTVIASNNDAR